MLLEDNTYIFVGVLKGKWGCCKWIMVWQDIFCLWFVLILPFSLFNLLGLNFVVGKNIAFIVAIIQLMGYVLWLMNCHKDDQWALEKEIKVFWFLKAHRTKLVCCISWLEILMMILWVHYFDNLIVVPKTSTFDYMLLDFSFKDNRYPPLSFFVTWWSFVFQLILCV